MGNIVVKFSMWSRNVVTLAAVSGLAGMTVAGPAVAQAIPPGPNTCVSGGGGFIGYGSYTGSDGYFPGDVDEVVIGGTGYDSHGGHSSGDGVRVILPPRWRM